MGLFLLLASLSCALLADNGGAFVGLDSNNSLVIRPPRDGQLLIDDADFRALVEKVQALEPLMQKVQALEQQAGIRQCKARADTAAITGLSSEYKWVDLGGVLAGNGKIYGIPNSSPSVLIIDSITNKTNTTTITGLGGTRKWSGGVLTGNGKIYGIPWDALSVLIIDPATNTADTTTITGLSGSAKWHGGVLANFPSSTTCTATHDHQPLSHKLPSPDTVRLQIQEWQQQQRQVC